jgi:uncharacterized membrane-anchored protein YjiN (DUF445 family)
VHRPLSGEVGVASVGEISPLGPVPHRREIDAHEGGGERTARDLRLLLALIDALGRPDFRAAVGDIVDDVVAGYRAQLSLYPRLLVGLASTFGLIDRERLVSALHDALKRIAADPDDPLRVRLTETLAALPGRLRTDPTLAARLEAAKEELLESPALARLVEDVAGGLRRTLAADLEGESPEVVAWIAARLERARRSLAEDAALRQDLDRWLKARIGEASDRYHDRIARFIERGVHALGPEGAVRLIEDHAGDDLQYIRVNGTVVGGLAGGGLYAIHLLLGLLG